MYMPQYAGELLEAIKKQTRMCNLAKKIYHQSPRKWGFSTFDELIEYAAKMYDENIHMARCNVELLIEDLNVPYRYNDRIKNKYLHVVKYLMEEAETI